MARKSQAKAKAGKKPSKASKQRDQPWAKKAKDAKVKARKQKQQKAAKRKDKAGQEEGEEGKRRRPPRKSKQTLRKTTKINPYAVSMLKSLNLMPAVLGQGTPQDKPTKAKKWVGAATLRRQLLAHQAREAPSPGSTAQVPVTAGRPKTRDQEPDAHNLDFKQGKDKISLSTKRSRGDDDAASDFSDDSLWNEIRELPEDVEPIPSLSARPREPRPPGAPPLPPVPQPPTLFVRNVPVMAEEGQLQERFAKFGPVRRVMLVVDRMTGAPKGTAFVHFREEAGLQACLEEAQRDLEWRRTLQAEATGGGDKKGFKEIMPKSRRSLKKERFRMQSADVTDLEQPAISWQGFRLLVHRAVSRDEASQYSRQQVKTKREKKADIRNLKFAREGRIRPGTPAAEGVDPKLLKQLEERYAEKKRKLRNPNFVVSKTRLCVHHIPQEVGENELRSIFIAAIKRYAQRYGDPLGDWDTRPVDRMGRRRGEDPTIKQVKLVVNSKRPDKHTGYGFLQFSFHEHALVALREINNNPNIINPKKRLYVEFAVDNMQNLKKLQEKHDRWQQKVQLRQAAPAPKEEAPSGPYVPHRQRLPHRDYSRLKKRLARKKTTPSYMKTAAYQDMVVNWIRQKKQRRAAG